MKKSLTALALFVSAVLVSQNVTSKAVKDTVVPLKYNFKHNQTGLLFLNNPSEFKISYDKLLNKFVLVEKIGSYSLSTPLYLSPKEYEKYRLEKDIKSYFKEKIDALDTRKKDNSTARKNLLPKYYVNSKFFKSVFGGNTVEVILRGQVNIKLGGVYQNSENPQISIDQQSSFAFDFDQQISTSLQATVGNRLKVNANYDTQSTFSFQNLIKLDYSPTEDDIIQAIEAGNINMPIKNALINGAQALFGIKTELQFGKTRVTAAFSQQNSQSKTVVAEGGATIEEFELRTSDYDNDRHFFLSQYFRENYKNALRQYPLINSPINITRVEVWVTNRIQDVSDFRSIVAIADLGESNTTATSDNLVNNSVADPDVVPIQANGLNLPYNEVNKLRELLTENGQIREVSTLQNAFANALISGVTQGTDFSYLQNARKLQENEYELHSQLGFISLNSRLNDGEVLAVAYEYTVVGASSNESVYKVGEFSNDGIIAPANLVVKLLRSEILSTIRPGVTPEKAFPTWRLMMKNIYNIGAYPLSQNGFRLDLLYRDDQTGILQNTLQNATTSNIENLPLMQIFHIDRLDQSQYQVVGGDGYFDFIEGVTVNSKNGYIIFPDPEPFGENSYLDNRLAIADKDKFLFKELYLTTKIQAKNEFQNKDKFFLKGYFKSETSRGISLGAFNIPRGSVRVSAGGRTLVEGIDYVVDYQLGRVQILDPGLEASGIPINATVENNTFFNQQRKTFLGIDIEHRFSDNFTLGATFLNVSEKPITPKVNFGGEPIDNIMLGLNLDFSSEVPYLTKLANKLPFVETEVPSKISVRTDMAYLLPGSPSGIDINGVATSYLDDFEASQIPIGLSSPQQWFLSSTPESQGFKADAEAINNLSYNNHRAKIAWYNIDQLFYGNANKPANIDQNELSRNEVRQIRYEELFDIDLDITQQNLVRTLDLAYYPSERGPYNYNTNADEVDIDLTNNTVSLKNPQNNWGGIMRPLTTNNFEQANVEYIQFWLMDPYENYSISEQEGFPTGINPNDASNHGKLFINLGNISEDILRDGSKQYENGLPEDGIKTQGSNVRESVWGFTPINPSILYAFATDSNARSNQDVGLDGLTDIEEKSDFHSSNSFPDAYRQLDDPSGDNFQFFRSGALDAANASILTRYKNYNNTQGNSPTAEQSTENYPTSSTTYPDTEDINRDQTMNPVSSYYEYEVSLSKTELDKGIGFNNIVDIKNSTVNLANGQTRTTKWYQFRIPVKTGVPVNGISDFNSIRFIRMFLTQFKIPVVLRFGEFELVRSDWRRYTKGLSSEELKNFEIGVVNIEQNSDKYQLPPGIERERLQGTNRIQRQNEQSVTLKVTNLPTDSLRVIYKNISIDMRRYKNLQMFLHAEDLNGEAVQGQDAGAVAVIRLGTDLSENYYEIEKPLKLSKSFASPFDVWPSENNLDILVEELAKLKLIRTGLATDVFSDLSSNGLKISVKGNPTLAQIRTVMLGVKNTSSVSKTIEVWFNELRAVGFDNKGGWAAVINADANLADIMNFSLGARISTIGFGNVEDRVQQRSIEQVKQYNLASQIQLGKMMPKKWNIQIPINYSYGEEFRDPQYDPQYQDISVEQAKEAADKQNNIKAKENIANAQYYTRRKSISFINVKKNRNPESSKKQRFYDLENFSVSYSFSEEFHKDYNIEKYLNQNLMAGANYAFSFRPLIFEPFKKFNFLNSKYLKLIKSFNLNPIPSSLAVSSRINRNFSSQTSRNLVQGLTQQPELKQRNFMFFWDYTLAFNLTKSIQLNFNASNIFIYDSFGKEEDLNIYDKFFSFGRPNNYFQKLNASYKIPLNTIPFLKFINADYAYTADFNWQATSQSPIFNEAGEQVGNIKDKVGNMVQNANTHNFNTTIDFERFYKMLKNTKTPTKSIKKDASKKLNNKQNTNTKLKPNKTKSFGSKALNVLFNTLGSVKRAKISYSQNNGILLQGYKPSVGFLGRSSYGQGAAPTLGFVFGSQTDILKSAIDKGWLVTRDPNDINDQYYNKSYGKNSNTKLDYAISIKPLKNLNIDIIGNKIQTSRLAQQLDIISDNSGVFKQNETIKAFETGDYSISYFMLGTFFSGSEKLYQNFKNNRVIIANKLYREKGISKPTSADSPGFKENGQQVMLPAFLSAYSGQSPNSISTGIFKNIPLPNWTLRYSGLMSYKWFKKNFSSFSLAHGYKSSYTIGNYTNNLQFEEGAANTSGNFQPSLLISSVTLIDEFSPLITVDFKLKNSLSFKGEIRSDRGLILNFNNNTITDVSGTEYVFGFGFKFRDVKFVTRFTGKKETLKGDVNLRADISLRNNLTLIRSIDQDNNQVTSGERLFGLKFLADYNLSKNITASFYYNHQTFNYAISTTFPRQSINAGLNLIYNLGN
ncbi:MAG: cell surface protein SprA [Tenacibaculum sp.]